MRIHPSHRRHLGNFVETLALNFLQRKGLRLLARNYQCRAGEIDLIVLQGNTLVFVEVRYRSTSSYGSAIESVTRSKQAKIVRCARHFVMRYPNHSRRNLRFDIVGISKTGNSAAYQIEWLENAFEPGYQP